MGVRYDIVQQNLELFPSPVENGLKSKKEIIIFFYLPILALSFFLCSLFLS